MYLPLITAIWSVLVLLMGGVIGYIVGSRKIDEVFISGEPAKSHPIGSGPLRVPTPLQVENRKHQSLIDRQKELMK